MSSSGTRTAQSSYAKFGAGETVPRCACTLHSQRDGRDRKASGDITAIGSPKYNAVSHVPMSPMSW